MIYNYKEGSLRTEVAVSTVKSSISGLQRGGGEKYALRKAYLRAPASS